MVHNKHTFFFLKKNIQDKYFSTNRFQFYMKQYKILGI